MRVGYCRVSTKTAEQAASIATQEQRLRDAGCVRVLVDHGISGFREAGRRGSEFPALIDLILDGTTTEVVVPNFDRTQRRMRWGIELLDALERTGARLLELDTGAWLDPANNPADVMMAQLRTVFQENESRTRRLKVRKALEARRAQGAYASGKVPFGYAHVDGQVVPHPVNWRLAQDRWAQLAEMNFNLAGWIKNYDASITPRGIRAWIENPTLRGEVNNRPGMCCEPLVTPEQWHHARRCLQARSLARGVSLDRQVRLFTGLVRCDACGKNLHTVTDRNVQRLKCKTRVCDRYGQGLRVSVVRDRVIQALVQANEAMAELASEGSPALTPEQLELMRRIEALEPFADDPDYAALIAKQRAQLAALREQPAGPDLELRRELLADPATLAMATEDELRAIVIEFVASIVWLGGLESLEITLR